MADGFIAHDFPVLDFSNHALVHQEVDVSDHLREGQERLRDRDVAPERLGDLVAGPGLARR